MCHFFLTNGQRAADFDLSNLRLLRWTKQIFLSVILSRFLPQITLSKNTNTLRGKTAGPLFIRGSKIS